MGESLDQRRRRLQLNKFIAGVAFRDEPVFESYRDLCKHLDEKLDYVDFEWKYYQFYNGNRLLALERSPDNSSPVTFSDLPASFLEKVLDELSLLEHLVLRKVSPDLRNLVDSRDVFYDGIGLDFGFLGSQIKTPDESIDYFQTVWKQAGRCEVISFRNGEQKIKVLQNSCYKKTMMTDVATFLKNPELKLGGLTCSVSGDEPYTDFLEYLKSLDFKLYVRIMHFTTEEKQHIRSILPFLKPKILEEISFTTEDVKPEEFDEIAETEQWKMAWKLQWNRFSESFRVEKMLHFRTIGLNRFEFSDENLIKIRDILLKSPHLEILRLRYSKFSFRYHDEPKMDTARDEQNITKIMSQDSAYNPDTRRFSIPGSRDYFQLQIERNDEEIELKIRRLSEH